MSFEGFPVTGWRTRTVRVHRDAGTPAVLVARSRGPLTSFFVRPVIDTPNLMQKGSSLFQTFGTEPHMFVLPGQYTHVELERVGREANGVARWNLDRVPIEKLRVLKDNATGIGAEVFTWHDKQGRVHFNFTHKHAPNWSMFEFFSFKEGEKGHIEIEGTTRGTAVIPGPGFVRIQSPGEWKINIS